MTANKSYYAHTHTDIESPSLDRPVTFTVFEPIENVGFMPLLLLNDGQDAPGLHLADTLNRLAGEGNVNIPLVVAVNAADRMAEYGVAGKTDYMKRGTKATAYTDFILNELLPYLHSRYALTTDPALNAIAGCSLGGLSAFDIAFHHPQVFGRVGVFSGSLWYRRRSSQSRFYSDKTDRIMHRIVRKSAHTPGLKFWFETGTDDERGDRNKNGIIDSIDDTLDLVTELVKIGYRPFHDIQYLEIPGGRHDIPTWADAMPVFLQWAFGK